MASELDTVKATPTSRRIAGYAGALQVVQESGCLQDVWRTLNQTRTAFTLSAHGGGRLDTRLASPKLRPLCHMAGIHDDLPGDSIWVLVSNPVTSTRVLQARRHGDTPFTYWMIKITWNVLRVCCRTSLVPGHSTMAFAMPLVGTPLQLKLVTSHMHIPGQSIYPIPHGPFSPGCNRSPITRHVDRRCGYTSQICRYLGMQRGC